MTPKGWKTYKVQEIASHQKNGIVDGPFGSNLKTEHYRDVGTPVIQSGFVTSNKFEADKYVYVDDDLFRQQIRSKVVPGDIVMAKIGANCGTCAILPANHPVSILAGNSLKITPNPELCNTEFLLFLFHHLYEETGFSGLKSETAQPAISIKNLKQLTVILPSLPEQRKIAEILSTWDHAIAKTKHLITALRERKKGLMQQLLTGKKRFPNFKDIWQEHSLGDIATITAGGTPSTSKKEYWNGDIRWMNSGEINLRYVWEVEGRITKIGLNNSSAKLIPINSVLIALAGQGKTRGTVAVNKVETTTNQSLAAIIPNPTKLNYLYLFFNLDNRYEEMRMLSGGNNGRGGLNLTILKNVKVKLPSLQEQGKISKILEACDYEIDLFIHKLEALKQQKKGLMQKLLTGQIRVKV